MLVRLTSVRLRADQLRLRWFKGYGCWQLCEAIRSSEVGVSQPCVLEVGKLVFSRVDVESATCRLGLCPAYAILRWARIVVHLAAEHTTCIHGPLNRAPHGCFYSL